MYEKVHLCIAGSKQTHQELVDSILKTREDQT